ncbi:MAG: hypothetical protein AAGF12_17055 [Myxococcota bacterium]
MTRSLSLCVLLCALIGAPLALGACGNDEEGSSSSSGGSDTNFGTVTLQAGFTAPHVVEGRSGGTTDASSVSAECVGTIDSTPDHALELSAAMAGLRIFAAAEEDITLVIQKPDGSYLCNDDSDGTNPMVSMESFPAGTYKIWIGNYNVEEGGAAYKLGFSTAADASPALLAEG